MPEGDSAFGQIVGRHLQCDPVSRQHADPIPPQLPGKVRQNGAILIELNAKLARRELLNDGSSDFNAIFLAHPPP
jgi:hypothetical protein